MSADVMPDRSTMLRPRGGFGLPRPKGRRGLVLFGVLVILLLFAMPVVLGFLIVTSFVPLANWKLVPLLLPSWLGLGMAVVGGFHLVGRGRRGHESHAAVGATRARAAAHWTLVAGWILLPFLIDQLSSWDDIAKANLWFVLFMAAGFAYLAFRWRFYLRHPELKATPKTGSQSAKPGSSDLVGGLRADESAERSAAAKLSASEIEPIDSVTLGEVTYHDRLWALIVIFALIALLGLYRTVTDAMSRLDTSGDLVALGFCGFIILGCGIWIARTSGEYRLVADAEGVRLQHRAKTIKAVAWPKVKKVEYGTRWHPDPKGRTRRGRFQLVQFITFHQHLPEVPLDVHSARYTVDKGSLLAFSRFCVQTAVERGIPADLLEEGRTRQDGHPAAEAL